MQLIRYIFCFVEQNIKSKQKTNLLVRCQVKGAVHNVRDALPDTTALKKKITHAKEQVEEKAHAVKETIKDALPSAKGQSGEPSEKIADPVFLEEAGKALAPPPLPQEKYKQ